LVRLRPYILLFAALIVIYHANLRPVDSSDTLPGSLIPLAIVLDHSVTLDRFVPWLKQHVPYTRAVIVTRNGHFYSQYPIGGPVFASPLYLPLTLFGLRNWDPGSLVMFARVAEKFAATFITALSAPFLLLLLKRITSTGWAWCFTLVYALGTATWSISSQALWQHGPAELALVGTLLCLAYWSEHRTSKDPTSMTMLWICGACTACAFIFRPTNIVLLPAILAGLLLAKASIKEHVRFWTVPLLGGLLIVSYNLYVFHQVSGGYGLGGLRARLWAGLAVILVSPGRGLLIFTPVALFAACAFFPGVSAARRKHAVLVVACSVFVILDLIVIAKWRVWWGGYCWGPRLLTELVPPLIVLMAIGVSVLDRPWPRRAFVTLALYSVLIQAIGVFFYPKGRWDGGPPNVNSAPARVWDWRDNPIVRTIRGGPEWEPYAVIGTAITSGIPSAQRRMRELNANPYDEAPPEGVAPAPRELR
jgi:hypothetical protein